MNRNGIVSKHSHLLSHFFLVAIIIDLQYLFLFFQYSTILGRLEKLGVEQELQIRSVGSDSSYQVSALDSKTRTMIDETRAMLKSYKLIEEGEREKLEARLIGLVEKSLAHRDTTIVSY
jgi:hypothetical protein